MREEEVGYYIFKIHGEDNIRTFYCDMWGFIFFTKS